MTNFALPFVLITLVGVAVMLPATRQSNLSVAQTVFTADAQRPKPTPTPVVDDDVIRVSTNLVTIPVMVKTRQGAYIPNLDRQNFRVLEDGVEQDISDFETVNQPFTVALMLDVSDSTRAELQQIQDAALAFLDELRPDDRALIVAFDKNFTRLTEVTGDRKVLRDGIRRTNPGGGTALYDALATTINVDLKRVAGRKAIVLLTDGIDTSSVNATFESTARSANEQYALIYPVQWDTSRGAATQQLSEASGSNAVMHTTPSGEPLRKAFERGTRFLQLIAQTSGGRFHYAENVPNLRKAFARIAEELREQYSLSYYPKNQDAKRTKRRIKITVNVDDAVVHARENYLFK
ncbi:MAG TPA: VWA domain-containing protein [Pyrinomonadaceae bacterium]|nr:VWA domain-containing protein [Pyrinomonadaceae bacterium]